MGYKHIQTKCSLSSSTNNTYKCIQNLHNNLRNTDTDLAQIREVHVVHIYIYNQIYACVAVVLTVLFMRALRHSTHTWMSVEPSSDDRPFFFCVTWPGASRVRRCELMSRLFVLRIVEREVDKWEEEEDEEPRECLEGDIETESVVMTTSIDRIWIIHTYSFNTIYTHNYSETSLSL